MIFTKFDICEFEIHTRTSQCSLHSDCPKYHVTRRTTACYCTHTHTHACAIPRLRVRRSMTSLSHLCTVSTKHWTHRQFRKIIFYFVFFKSVFLNHRAAGCNGPWHQLYRAARGSPGISYFSFLSNFHE